MDLRWCRVSCRPFLVINELLRRHCVVSVVSLVLCIESTVVRPIQDVKGPAGVRDDMFGSADLHKWQVFLEHSPLMFTRSFKKAVYTSRDARPSVSFTLLQDYKERSFLGGVRVGVVSLIDADFHRGDGIAVVRDGGAVAVGVA